MALRVAEQYDGFASAQSSLLEVADSMPAEVGARWRELVAERIAPMMSAQAAYLREGYAPRARQSRSLSDLPGGSAGYEAFVSQHTGARIDLDELAERARDLLEEGRRKFAAIGERFFESADYDSALAAYKANRPTALGDPNAVREYAREAVNRLLEVGAPFFPELPENGVRVELFPEREWSIAYDFGGDFIYGLRERAKAALGEAFDIRTFHRLVLEGGSATLARLEQKIEDWIASGE